MSFFLKSFLILSIIDTLFIYLLPQLNFKSKFVIILFTKSNVNSALCYSSINEFRRTKNLFSYIPRHELDFVEIDCQDSPSKCDKFMVYSVPQIHAYVINSEFLQEIKNQSIEKNSTDNNIYTETLNFNEYKDSKINEFLRFINFYPNYVSLPKYLQYLNKLSPISFVDYFFNIFKRNKIVIYENIAEGISYLITNFSYGKYKPNLKKYTLTPERSPAEISRLVFHKYKCSISTFYQYLIPTNIREFYDNILLNETFKSLFSFQEQIETSFVDGLKYRYETKRRYNISSFPMIAFEYMGLKTITNTSISMENLKKILLSTCNSSFTPSTFPGKKKKRSR